MTRERLRTWFLDAEKADPGGYYEDEREATSQHHVQPWWKVMCLTGVDYFSTLGYQPGIAALAAGAVAPVATLVLVLITLFGALPMYRRVATESPRGDGSLSMLERLLSYWGSKLLVLALLGFVATGFIITITLSAADASAHLIENPFVHDQLSGAQVAVTLTLIALLAAVFLKGFTEAIGVAVVLVVAYLGLSAVVIGDGLLEVVTHPDRLGDWTDAMSVEHSLPFGVIGAALLVFPALALGLSGFETGVVVMPLVKGDPDDTPQRPLGRIRNAKKLLTTAALIMSVLLISSSLVTTVLIPHEAFEAGGEANGRALAYLAHERLGEGFGTAYDVATIGILWFAGASAMAGLLNIVPRYLPRYGMAPDWARSTRPLVVVLTVIAALVTLFFRAEVDAQAGAYATGVLALMTSAAVAVFLTELKRGHRRNTVLFAVVSAVFVYTSAVTVVKDPEGLFIALLFVAMIVVISVTSRIQRSTELRVQQVVLDDVAHELIRDAARPGEPLRFIANKLDAGDDEEYVEKSLEVRLDNHLSEGEEALFLEVEISDASDFTSPVRVTGTTIGKHRVLRAVGTSVPNVLAAVLLYVRDHAERPPHAYFEWSEQAPGQNVLRFLLAGEGDIPPLTHEILRRAEPDESRRPYIHVGG
ncbi:amino acid transporter [Luteipulveratus sp. YIM 133132]|uniref:amino acid transporter n=1 Tax=Luteipulveratus flavus TaxID=3031728 RepID=UPI0023B04E73|nr:amino acid transporter [Luteipulveratus sp. YIM 133132]MDE9367916.1 amino acid transporter [Luteipulveratus sp. YIM 133132]